MVLNKSRILALLLVVVTFVGCGEDEEEAELKIGGCCSCPGPSIAG